MNPVPAARRIGRLTAAGLWFVFGCGGGSAPPVAPSLPAPPPPVCTSVTVEMDFLGRGASPEISRGRLTLESTRLDTSVHFQAPYTIEVPDGGANLDIPGLRPTLSVFVSDLDFAVLGSGYRQTMTLEWLSELEFHALEPNCPPLTFSCDASGCTGP